MKTKTELNNELDDLKVLSAKKQKELDDLRIKLLKLEDLNKQQFEMIVHLERQIIEYEKQNNIYRRFPKV